jgi:hypothetical protein
LRAKIIIRKDKRQKAKGKRKEDKEFGARCMMHVAIPRWRRFGFAELSVAGADL